MPNAGHRQEGAMDYLIRREKTSDYRVVEEVTRKAFWNVHAPGCDEHYLVHIMRNHNDFIPDLDFVLEVNQRVIGNIMYTKSKLKSESADEKTILTFGPVSILPEYQRKGYGKRLIEYSLNIAANMGYDVIVIFGNPSNYVSLGFQSCKRLNVCYGDEIYPTALLVKELKDGAVNRQMIWTYQESEVYNIDKEKAEQFDSGFDVLEKKITPSQEEFFILSNSRIVPITF